MASLILFAILIGSAVFCALSILILTWCGCKLTCLRFILHILWNIIYLITILTFILGALYGIIGSISVDLRPVIKYILSDEYLNSANSLIKDLQVAKYISICVNGKIFLSR